MEEGKEDSVGGNVKVICRFRPLNEREAITGDLIGVNISDDNKNISLQSSTESGEPLKFNFDYVFRTTSQQRQVYEISAKPIVEAVMQGFNGTVFAYGQTSSGKTFTMTGPDLENPETMGVIPRMVTTVFDMISNSDPYIEYAVRVSYCEIYLEKIKDLLDINKTNLKVHEDKTKGVFIAELTERYVAAETDVYEIMKYGLENRNVGSTNMNSQSSRSHSIFLITITQTNNRDYMAKTGKLYLVDLAGSEKVGKTGATGKRLDEAKNINKSLTMLGLVIYSLTDGKSTHIPYRDSKLTRVLQDSLGGNSKTALIITCSPSLYNEAETISTLRFGMRAKAIKNTPKINREYTVAELKLMLAKCREEMAKKDRRIKMLEDQLKSLGGKVPESYVKEIRDDEEGEVEAQAENNKNEDYDEIIAELEDVRTKLTEEVKISKRMETEVKDKMEEVNLCNGKIFQLTQEIKSLKDKIPDSTQNIQDRENLIERLQVTKEALESERFLLNQKIIDLEKKIGEKDAEIHEITNKSSSPGQRNSVNNFKDLLKSEREINSGYQKEIQQLRQNVSDLLNKKCPESRINEIMKDEIGRRERDKWVDERKKIILDLQTRIDKVTELEIALDDAKVNCKALESYMSEGERSLKKKTDTLERNLEQLTLMYQQLISQKSQLGVDKQLTEKRLNRMTDRNKTLEEENSRLQMLYETAEMKIAQLSEESFCNSNKNSRVSIGVMNIKKTIMGGNPASKRPSVILAKNPFSEE
ncbi:hypothetical protein SteCoe_36958 [Stentor coeruleus]|uniref:Kinesin-like protein n=1 Tax=Stentor coeruleus TaxID=5963 RepID=A0A1R2APC9_9CILI|nr:hypothetical protein SteCoe_36958 [Stentor coeruleus]